MFSGITWRAMCIFFFFLIVKIVPHLKGLREENLSSSFVVFGFFNLMQSAFLKSL